MTLLVTVYGLRASDDDIIRYVGQTKHSLAWRLKYHLVDAQRFPNRHVSKWIKAVLRSGAVIVPFVIEAKAVENEAEIRWIAHYKMLGARLVNGTVGGEGCSGYVPSAETRRKLRAAGLGRKRSPEAIAKMVKAHLGRKNSPETIAKMVAVHSGKKCPWRAQQNYDPVFQEKSRLARIVRWEQTPKKGPDAEAKAKISASLKGIKRSLETRKLMSLGRTKAWAERKAHVVS